ncbi:MAG: MerR family DNA-binding transcriptional regulator [Candidatus Helarchaeota archaeon]
MGVCTKTLRRWESSGRFLPTFRTAGGHRHYSRDAWDEFAAAIGAST